MNISLNVLFKSLYFCYSDIFEKLLTQAAWPITPDCKQHMLAQAENGGLNH